METVQEPEQHSAAMETHASRESVSSAHKRRVERNGESWSPIDESPYR